MKKLMTIAMLFFTFNLFSQETETLKVGKAFPTFELETLEGELLSLEELKGKVVFINLWFTRCAPCIEEMPTLNDLQAEYKDKLEFLSITFDDAEQVKKFLSKRDFDFQHLVNAKSFLNDTLKNREYPKNLILNRNGHVTYLRGSIPFYKDTETGEIVPRPYTFFKEPIEEALAN